MNTQKFYKMLRRNWRIAVKNGEMHQINIAVSLMREFTGKWDAGFGPKGVGHFHYKYYTRFSDIGDNHRYAKFRHTKHGHYTLHTTNTLRWTLKRWNQLDQQK